ncbi:hypothetical protein MHH33_01580 [Paenisporosarcina sp. FSL H8-0542]|uniref:hypothetical protein n=1 Tax=Paenisporosarcina sp. FSL H8-0542 TaxID=2921401 RepID=UPI00315A975C
MKTINVAFDIPLYVFEGLNSGAFIRKGGVVVQKDTQRVVMWLKEGTKFGVESRSIIAQVTSLGKASLTLADFLYMHDNFERIHQRLSEINLKIDAQNFSKINSGFSLAMEAEKMKDKEIAKNQMFEARQLLEEGSKIFQHILNNLEKKDKKFKEKSISYLNLIIQAELGIIRTYMWHDEYEIAKLRLLKLRSFLLQNIFKQIENQITPHIAWYWKVLPFALGGLPTVIQNAIKDHLSYKEMLRKELKNVKEENLEIEEKLNLLLSKLDEESYLLSDDINHLLNVDEFIQGYEYELTDLNEIHNSKLKLAMSEPSFKPK